MAKLCVSFGQGHRHELNGVIYDKDCIAVISADTVREADQMAFMLWDGKFHQHVDKEKWDDSQMHYFPRGYIEVN